MALTQTQLSTLAKALDQRYESLLEEVRDELEQSENQQYVELIGRTPADSGDQSVGDALADLNLGIIDRHIHFRNHKIGKNETRWIEIPASMPLGFYSAGTNHASFSCNLTTSPMMIMAGGLTSFVFGISGNDFSVPVKTR